MNKKKLFLLLFLIFFNGIGLPYWFFFDRSFSGILQILFCNLFVLTCFFIFLLIKRKHPVKIPKDEDVDVLFAFRTIFSEGREL